MEDVIISMQSVQNYDDEEDANTLNFITDGQYSFDHDIGCLTYEESEVFGLPGTKTSVFIMPDRVVVDRNGSLTSRMVFKEGEKTVFPYHTPYGRALMGINTRKILHSFNEKGGTAEIEYVMDVEHSVISKNKFTIQVKQAGGMLNA